MSKERTEYIVVDRKVAQAFVHHANHLECQFVEPVCRDLKLKMKAGLRDMSVGEIVDRAKERVDRLAEYFRNALEEREDQPQQ
jgi:hypothetical protein